MADNLPNKPNKAVDEVLKNHGVAARSIEEMVERAKQLAVSSSLEHLPLYLDPRDKHPDFEYAFPSDGIAGEIEKHLALGWTPVEKSELKYRPQSLVSEWLGKSVDEENSQYVIFSDGSTRGHHFLMKIPKVVIQAFRRAELDKTAIRTSKLMKPILDVQGMVSG